VCGFSRLGFNLNVAQENSSEAVLSSFLQGEKQYGLPSRIRSGRGLGGCQKARATQDIATQGLAMQGLVTHGLATQGLATQSPMTQDSSTQGRRFLKNVKRPKCQNGLMSRAINWLLGAIVSILNPNFKQFQNGSSYVKQHYLFKNSIATPQPLPKYENT
jgi:hypothetical protein